MVVDKRKNCLNVIRLIAAIQVFVGHAIPAFDLTLPQPIDFIARILNIFEGVPVFFCLSGFLLWDSIARTPDLKTYLKKRVFRLYPELWGGVLINIVVMIILYGQYIQWGDFSLFQLTQGTIFQFWTPDSLRGYATGTPNGPLWTICVMVQAYAALWFLHKFLHKKGLKRWVIVLIVATAINTLRPLTASFLPPLIYKISFYTFITHIWLFLVGAFMSEYFDQIIGWLKKFWWVALIISQTAVITGFDYGSYDTIKSLFLGIGIIGLGYAIPKLNLKADFSYGLYIYHMIVINVMVHFGCSKNLWWMVVALVISGALAVASYYTIGVISRKLRKKAEVVIS